MDHDRGPYDPDPVAEQDLWFLPGDGGEDEGLPPGPRAERVRLFDPNRWQAAQDQLSRPLAELAALFGALDERLRGAPEGWHQRLALLEVADLGWWTGDRIASDRLALWVGLRLGATGEDAQAVIRAGWAVRRLSAGPGPSDGGWEAGLAAFLGRAAADGERPESLADLADFMADTAALHPVTQGAMLFHGWRMLGPERAGQGATIDVEAAVLAARHAAGAGRGGALFLPLALTGPTALRATGTEAERLGAWIAGAAQATQAALLQLDRLRDWDARARAATTDLSGRTPPALITALAAWPMISAPLAEAITDASRAAVQRNLDRFATRGLIRELTGAGRYRVWAAQV
ncbi:hypothetical protein OU426_16335 [Frigidibacter sp. RF13]|uniref:hypothetical protein n=1 Tax=Frigidibacter sp. RF13 TaxID=2997340 RepID=UPI00226E0300|nr:hypothetical protein [Frigidibacter sp. RF13]MCY1128434.1 hypothetical protein [Frigidibacter sp. RF13]